MKRLTAEAERRILDTLCEILTPKLARRLGDDSTESCWLDIIEETAATSGCFIVPATQTRLGAPFTISFSADDFREAA